VSRTKIFLDTNILVYTMDGHDSEKQAPDFAGFEQGSLANTG